MIVIHVSQQICSEGIHSNNTGLYRTPPKTCSNPQKMLSKTQGSCCLPARSSECLWKCSSLTITFALKHYHAPPQFSGIVQSFYSHLSAKVSSSSWSTPLILLQTEFYQGDPLSAVIFNTVINTIVDTIKPDLTWDTTTPLLRRSIYYNMQTTHVS